MITLTLKRTSETQYGIFGELRDETGKHFCYTLEHAYSNFENGPGYEAKIPTTGIFTCTRGTHQLEHGGPFETFEVTGVTGHQGILFHPGNYNSDSDGCILVGNTQDDQMVGGSKDAFARLMRKFTGIDQFQLEVR